MRVVVSLDARFSRTPDGAVWTLTSAGHRFWTRYLSAFDQVRVVARVRDVPDVEAGATRVDGPGVEVWPVPHYLGPQQYLRQLSAIRRSVARAAEPRDAVILRVPSPIGALLAACRERARLPYALEVVGDPYDVFAPGVVRHPLRPYLRQHGARTLRQLCRRANAVCYVTERTLQQRYPTGPYAVSAACSGIELPAEAFAPAPRMPLPAPRAAEDGPPEAVLVSVGSLEQLYKGVDTLLTALARLTGAGRPVRLSHVGDGRYREHLEQLAAQLGVRDRVTFHGWLPAGPAVRRELDAADLFVMPSRTEGLPRALIEAMARGLPAVASTAGGIPELLPEEQLVPPDDPVRLAEVIDRTLASPARMAAASQANLARAWNYSVDQLTPRRDAFYRAVAASMRRPAGVGR